MKDLRELLEGSNLLKNVETYIQSGNIIFESEEENIENLENEFCTYIYNRYDFEVPVFVYTKEQWDHYFNNNPFLEKSTLHINRLFGTLLDNNPSEQNISRLKKLDFAPDSFIVSKDIIYTKYPNGIGKSKMTNTVFEKTLEVSSTTRNWKTISKIQELLSK